MNAVDLRVVYIIVVISNIVESRIKKYDINQQCMNMFGLDLSGVLYQFRRTDDYLQILRLAAEEFEDFREDVEIETLDYYRKELDDKISADMGFIKPTTTQTTTKLSGRRGKKSGRRQAEKPGVMAHDTLKNLEKVRLLEQYHYLNSYLTVEERNTYKDLAFTYAGEVIHSVISAFGGNPTEELVKSTRLIENGSAIANTTEHMLKHVATRVTKLTSKHLKPVEKDEDTLTSIEQVTLTNKNLVELVVGESTVPTTEHFTTEHIDKDTEPTTEQFTTASIDKDTEPTTEQLTTASIDKDTEPTTEHFTTASLEMDTEPTTEHLTTTSIDKDTETTTEPPNTNESQEEENTVRKSKKLRMRGITRVE